nr:hypothetical protein [Tanacetum cinerariifolium]
MHTRSFSNLPVESPPNPSTSNPKHHNRRRSKQPFILEESPVYTMADQRTMAELLRAPTEGYAEEIVAPPILAEQFELKHSLINMMTSEGSPSWLEKEPPRSIITLKDLVSKFFNEFFPPSRTTNLCNKILNYQQRFDESFHEAWDRYKDLLRACPHHGFTELHQLDTFYNALNPADQDSLNSAAGGNLLERQLKDNIQGYVAAAAFNYNQGNSGYRPLGVANQIRPSGFAQPNVQNNQNWFSQPQGYNRGNNFNPKQSYQAPTQQNHSIPLSELEKVKRMNEANMKSMQTQINNVKNELRNEMKNSTQASMSNQTNELKTMMASFFQMNTASTSEEDECVEETLTDQDLAVYTIKVPPPLVQKPKPPSQRNFVVHQRDPFHPNTPYPSRMLKQKQQEKDEVQIHKFWQMFKQLHINITIADALILIPKYQKILKALLSNKEKLLELANTPLNENCSAVIIKKLPKKLKVPGKFLIPCGFSELNCKALADLGASINLMPLSIWKKLESDPRVPLILGRPFLRTARALIDVHGEEMILRDGDERLTLNMRHNTTSYSNQPQKESIHMINIYDDSSENFLKNLFSINPLSGSTTSSQTYLLEEFADELTLITFPSRNDDLPFDIESDLKEIEYMLHHDPIKDIDSILKYSIDQSNLADLNDNLVDTMPEMFTDEHALDYSSPPLYDEYDDDLFEVESDTEYVYDDPFDSKGEKIKESELLIDELDLPSDFLPSFEYDSFLSKNFSKVDALPSTNNEDK